MVKHDSNNNKEELKSISEESEREMEEKIDSFELFSLKTLLPPQIPVKGGLTLSCSLLHLTLDMTYIYRALFV